jgi:hypothetical protein
MASPHSEPLTTRADDSRSVDNIVALLSALEESTRRGNWGKAAAMAAELDHLRVPADPEELGRYLGQLRRTLVTARTSRAHAAAFLRRVNAAAGFCRTRRAESESAERQNFVDSAEI